MKVSCPLRTLCVLCVFAVCLSLACSQNEQHPSGPAPEAPKEARVAKVVPAEGAGMNAMPAEEPMPGPPEESAAPPKSTVVYTGTVELSPGLKGVYPKGGSLFVVARDPKDPGAPAAAARLPLDSFPVPFRLTDANSMSGAPLGEHLDLLARLSASGAIGEKGAGDLEAKPVHGHPGEPVRLVLENP